VSVDGLLVRHNLLCGLTSGDRRRTRGHGVAVKCDRRR